MKILIIDDERSIRNSLKEILGDEGYEVDVAEDGMAALSMVDKEKYNVIFCDIKMPGMDGTEVLDKMVAEGIDAAIVMISGHGDIDTAVECIKKGAFDYIQKPLDLNRILITIKNASEKATIISENKTLKKKVYGQKMIGESEPVRHVKDIIAKVAPTDARVLIVGPNGSGKELVARSLHEQSARSSMPYIEVNCAAIPSELIESELFGHEKGAFTSAIKQHKGKFEQADGGTLFLDEIGEMPLSLQAKLLRALQQGEVQRVGSDSPITVDVRVIAATNRNLREEVEQKRFREDLFFRLNVISIEVPALRERSEDIPLLAAHFLEKFAARNRKNVKGFAPQALDMLRRYSWPGNVRELQNAVERAVILCTGDLITGPELPASVTGAAEQAAPVPETAEASLAGLSLEALERRAIEDTLRQTEDNKSEAARRLGITRATLHNKLRKYGLE